MNLAEEDSICTGCEWCMTQENRRWIDDNLFNQTTGKFTPDNTDTFEVIRETTKQVLDDGVYRKAFSLEKFFGLEQMLK